MPVSVFVTMTVTPGRTPPVVSAIVPSTAPRTACPAALRAACRPRSRASVATAIRPASDLSIVVSLIKSTYACGHYRRRRRIGKIVCLDSGHQPARCGLSRRVLLERCGRRRSEEARAVDGTVDGDLREFYRRLAIGPRR